MMYGFFVCCSDCMGVCGKVCYVVAVLNIFFPWSIEVCCMFVL